MADDPKKPTKDEQDAAAAETAKKTEVAEETPSKPDKPKPKPKKTAAAKAKAKAAPEAKPSETEAEPKPKAKPRRRRKPKAEAVDTKPASAPAPTRRARPAPGDLPTVRASARYVRISPRKARLVADQVRGMHIERARALLQFSAKGAARDIHKLIDSAAANAENNHDLIGDEMRITDIRVDEGPTLKRYRPRALGRATPIHKRTSHISVALTPEED